MNGAMTDWAIVSVNPKAFAMLGAHKHCAYITLPEIKDNNGRES